MPMKVCEYCHQLIPIGTTCDCEKSRQARARSKKESSKTNYSNRKARGSYTQFYSSSRWKKLRDMIRSQQLNLDLYLYKTEGKIISDADEKLIVHHIIPREEDSSRQYDPNNLILVSHSTHEWIHREYNKSESRKKELQNILFKIVKEFNEERLLM